MTKVIGRLASHKSLRNIFRRIQMKGLSWAILESIGPSKSKGCNVRTQCQSGSSVIDSIVRFCICYRRRVRKGSYDRNERKARPRARYINVYVGELQLETAEFLVGYGCA